MLLLRCWCCSVGLYDCNDRIAGAGGVFIGGCSPVFAFCPYARARATGLRRTTGHDIRPGLLHAPRPVGSVRLSCLRLSCSFSGYARVRANTRLRRLSSVGGRANERACSARRTAVTSPRVGHRSDRFNRQTAADDSGDAKESNRKNTERNKTISRRYGRTRGRFELFRRRNTIIAGGPYGSRILPHRNTNNNEHSRIRITYGIIARGSRSLSALRRRSILGAPRVSP